MNELNPLIEKAAQLCVEKHKGQVDNVGQAYILHPMRVAMSCRTDAERVVAMLHDTIEDTDVTPEYLLSEGFPQYIVDAILSVTKREGETYDDFIKRCALNPIGRQVKLRDLEDNMNVLRLNEVSEDMARRLTKYIHAHRFLTSFISQISELPV